MEDKDIIHKGLNGSRLKDNAPAGYRTTYCGNTVENTKISHRWNGVTCPDCWDQKRWGDCEEQEG